MNRPAGGALEERADFGVVADQDARFAALHAAQDGLGGFFGR